WIMVLGYFISLIGNFIFLRHLTKINLRPDFTFIKENPKLKKDVLSFTLLLFFSGISGLIVTKLDLIFISKLRVDLSEVAIYSIGFNLATIIEIPKRTVLQVATPIISNLMKEEKHSDVETFNKKNGTNQLI